MGYDKEHEFMCFILMHFSLPLFILLRWIVVLSTILPCPVGKALTLSHAMYASGLLGMGSHHGWRFDFPVTLSAAFTACLQKYIRFKIRFPTFQLRAVPCILVGKAKYSIHFLSRPPEAARLMEQLTPGEDFFPSYGQFSSVSGVGLLEYARFPHYKGPTTCLGGQEHSAMFVSR